MVNEVSIKNDDVSPTNNIKKRTTTPRIIRRKKKSSSTSTTSGADTSDIPAHLLNNTQLQHIISTTLPQDYEFEILKTIWRIEKANATAIALQLPEGLTMYASTIGDILVKFAYRFSPLHNNNNSDEQQKTTKLPKEIKSLSILGDVTYGACCIDDLSARALGCDLLVHYGHSCLVPLTCTVIPCLYVFVEIRVDVQHLVDCVKLTFAEEEKDRQQQKENDSVTESTHTRIIEALVMGTVQFRSAVVESSQRIDGSSSADQAVQFEAIVPQAKPLSPGEVLGCTAPKGLATMDYQEALTKTRRRIARRGGSGNVSTAAVSTDVNDTPVTRERVMIFLADGRFHLEAAMISNPSLRALRYDPYSKTLTEEKYEIVKMKKLRRDAVLKVRRILGISSPTQKLNVVSGSKVDSVSSDDIANNVLKQQSQKHIFTPSKEKTITMGIILGTLGRQGNPAILSRIRTLLRSYGVRTIIVLLSEIFPRKLEMMSNTSQEGGGVCAWVQIACPRLSIDWGHYFCVPVLSPFELFVALGQVVDTSLWVAAGDEESKGEEGSEDSRSQDNKEGYPMDFYSKEGGPWANYYDANKERKVLSYGN